MRPRAAIGSSSMISRSLYLSEAVSPLTSHAESTRFDTTYAWFGTTRTRLPAFSMHLLVNTRTVSCSSESCSTTSDSSGEGASRSLNTASYLGQLQNLRVGLFVRVLLL